MTTQSQAFQLWHAKHWANFCGIGVTMKGDNGLCPCGQQVSESNTIYLYLCPHPKVAIAREESFHLILTWLETVRTDPLILEIINVFGTVIISSWILSALKLLYLYIILPEISASHK